MIRTVWKYPAPIKDDFWIDMPLDAEILTVQVQQDVPCVWALVDPAQGIKHRRSFRWIGTGHEHDFPFGLVHIGTVQLEDGRLVFHLFEEAR